ncbi:hypothetical protein PVL29_005243 [Vitis rotundifolia]|uniref:Uncharacterized protein n=1 Tax=Vitis rotundifolia TaxID=103349 RepID=A0AA39AAY0_VITRO|nr:hypothetical protein PVL29_005243 [Vitis rotundifolia]
MSVVQDVSQECKELDVPAGGNKTETSGPGAQSALRAPCSFWNEDGSHGGCKPISHSFILILIHVQASSGHSPKPSHKMHIHFSH